MTGKPIRNYGAAALAPMLLCLLLPAAVLLAPTLGAAADGRPNVVLIVADDLGFGDIGAGSPNRIKTPNLDSLARSGITLTSFYSSANVCTPSRTGIPTGRYAIRAGLAWKVLVPNDTRGLSTDETTISSLMKGAGYVTAAVGKWHLGDRPEFHPFRHGFDVFFGVKYSNDMLPFVLFDMEDSEPERYSLARDNPEVVERLWGELKRTRTEFDAMRTRDPEVEPEGSRIAHNRRSRGGE